MPLIPGLDFAHTSLWVAYRASPNPQEIVVQVDTAGPSSIPVASGLMAAVVDHVNSGAAGGSRFAPGAGSAKIVSGPPPEAVGPSYAWTLEVAGVDPLYVRNVVERLRLSGGEHPVVAMSVRGALAPDGTELSATERDVKRWLDDMVAYPGEWANLGFAVTHASTRGVALRVELEDRITADVFVALESLFTGWLEAVMFVVRNDGAHVREEPIEFTFSSGFGRTEYQVCLKEFEHQPAASRAALVNMLCRFHTSVSPIRQVELRL